MRQIRNGSIIGYGGIVGIVVNSWIDRQHSQWVNESYVDALGLTVIFDGGSYEDIRCAVNDYSILRNPSIPEYFYTGMCKVLQDYKDGVFDKHFEMAKKIQLRCGTYGYVGYFYDSFMPTNVACV
jgi:hypothetical protein